MSSTVTVKLPLAVFPWASVAEQFTVVSPTANVLPEAGEQPTLTDPSTASLADAEKRFGQVSAGRLRDLIISGRAKPSTIVSHRLPIDAADDAYREFEARSDGHIKVVLSPNGG